MDYKKNKKKIIRGAVWESSISKNSAGTSLMPIFGLNLWASTSHPIQIFAILQTFIDGRQPSFILHCKYCYKKLFNKFYSHSIHIKYLKTNISLKNCTPLNPIYWFNFIFYRYLLQLLPNSFNRKLFYRHNIFCYIMYSSFNCTRTPPPPPPYQLFIWIVILLYNTLPVCTLKMPLNFMSLSTFLQDMICMQLLLYFFKH